MKKMIYVLNHYSSSSTEHFFHVMNLLGEIADEGVKILLVIERADTIPEVLNKNIEVVCQRKKNKLLRVLELYSILRKYMKKDYKKVFIRISVNSTLISILAAKLYGGEIFYWQSGTTYHLDKEKYSNKKIKWFFSKYLKTKMLIENVDFFVTGPKTMLDYYHKEVGVKREKLKLLYNDINIRRFTPVTHQLKMKIREELNIPKEKKIILVVHRLSPVRKTAYYLPYIIDKDVFRKTNATIIVVGEGPEKEELITKINNEGYSEFICFVGSKPNKEIEKYYKAADVFLNPSYTEGFPRVIIEAMACGLPIVTTDAGGTKDLFRDNQSKFVCPKENRNQLKNALNMLLENPTLIPPLIDENLNSSLNYSTEKVSKMYIREIFYE